MHTNIQIYIQIYKYINKYIHNYTNIYINIHINIQIYLRNDDDVILAGTSKSKSINKSACDDCVDSIIFSCNHCSPTHKYRYKHNICRSITNVHINIDTNQQIYT